MVRTKVVAKETIQAKEGEQNNGSKQPKRQSWEARHMYLNVGTVVEKDTPSDTVQSLAVRHGYSAGNARNGGILRNIAQSM